ncbi:MAG: UDP-N-acetylglucosamine diphosphorylase/glucosamine-1-phosphate N-acetyltransferase [Parvicella sp.]|jgi:UDP-N-acetylglucosamine diphosphorylase/glucosamine-1-phosphate N-acetyltransferase
MNTILFDGVGHLQLQPLTFTKPVAQLRVGILTLQDKWTKHLGEEVGVRTKDYLTAKFEGQDAEVSLGILAGLLPTEDLVDTIKALKKGELLVSNDVLLAIKPMPASDANMEKVLKGSTVVKYDLDVDIIQFPWDIFKFNGQEICNDYVLLTDERESAELDETNIVKGEDVFIEEGADVSCAILNSENGPIYIGRDAVVMEGAVIRGPFALCDHATIKMGAKMYGDTTVGPHSKVGGEIGNSVIQGYSNKGHDGYLGNSVIGEWCNLGADTNTSNLKNNYGEVKAWSYKEEAVIPTGLQFCGLIMGDHSKSSINTMFNTGTVVGTCANVFDAGFPDKHIPSFSWGGKGGYVQFKLDKSIEVAARVMERRDIELTEEDEKIFTHLSNESAKYFTK